MGVNDLQLVQEGLLRKLVAAGGEGLPRSQLVTGGHCSMDKKDWSLRRLELAGMVRVERRKVLRQSFPAAPYRERWFALVDNPTLERGLDWDGEPYKWNSGGSPTTAGTQHKLSENMF